MQCVRRSKNEPGKKKQSTTATWFMRKEEILTDLNVDAADDISLKEEDDFISLVEKEGYDVIFADPCMERMIPGFEGVFIPLTHFAVSGKLKRVSRIYGKPIYFRQGGRNG